MLDMLNSDNKQLFKDLNHAKQIVENEKKRTAGKANDGESSENNAGNSSSMESFLVDAEKQMNELSSNIEKMQKSYSKTLKVNLFSLIKFNFSNFNMFRTFIRSNSISAKIQI